MKKMFTNYMLNMYKHDLALTYKGWSAIKPDFKLYLRIEIFNWQTKEIANFILGSALS